MAPAWHSNSDDFKEFERRWLQAKPDRAHLSFAPTQRGLIQLGGVTMTGLVRKATLLSAGGLLIAGTAMAGIPSAANCTMGGQAVDGHGLVVNKAAQNVVSISSTQMLVIRDTDNNPVPFVEVTFQATTDPFFMSDGVGINIVCADLEVELCDAQNPAWTGGAVTTGAGETVTATTDGAGQLFVTLLGAGPNFTCSAGTPVATCATDDPAAPSRPKCVRITAGGTVVLGRVFVTNANYDLNGSGGANAPDGSAWLVDRNSFGPAAGTRTYNSRSDYNGDGTINAVDGSILSAAIVAALPNAPCIVLP
jgi:hypothetical protein